MILREALVTDIPQIQIVRNSVKENMLSNPALATDKDCENYLLNRGKGWVCEIENEIVGFAIIDLKEKNICALFVNPAHERKGVGKRLQQIMLDWDFENNDETVWLGTSPGTRAESFYRRSGWRDVGRRANGEIKFEMAKKEWKNILLL